MKHVGESLRRVARSSWLLLVPASCLFLLPQGRAEVLFPRTGGLQQVQEFQATQFYDQGQQKFAANNYRGAIADYTAAIVRDPAWAAAWSARAATWFRLRNYGLAIQDLNQVIRLTPTAIAFHDRGVAKAANGDHRAAIPDYDQAILLKLDYPKAYNNRALAYAKIGYPQQALFDLNQSIRLDPSYVDAYNNRGVIRFDLKDYTLAIADFNTALKLKPDDAEAMFNRARARLQTGDKSGARTDFQQAAVLFGQQNKPQLQRTALEQFQRLQSSLPAAPKPESLGK